MRASHRLTEVRTPRRRPKRASGIVLIYILRPEKQETDMYIAVRV